MENPWSKEIDEIFKELNTGLQGLSGEDVRKRLERVGRNKLREIKGVTALQIFIEQWKNLFVILLLIASFIEIGMGIYHIEDEGIYDLLGGFLIVIIVLFIVILGFYQEYNAEKSLQALKKMLSPMTIVIRGGETKQIPAENLVPGDIVIIEAGDRIPADGRLIETSDLKVDESALTGESMPIGKNVKTLNGNVSIGDRTNMVFMGTSATYGRGSAVITATGMNTELGKIAREVQTIEREQTPLQRKMDDLGKKVSIAVVFVCFIIFLSLVLTNLDKLDTNLLLNMFIIAVALAVAAVPEALPGVVTIGLSLGTRRLVEKNALIRKLPAVETLGSTTI
ncbi:MAG TPA: ATPase, partial [Candidatus Altiarchaeales archaeon]|nr:ATPase [Candidatus Altiarchaeales archaeon]